MLFVFFKTIPKIMVHAIFKTLSLQSFILPIPVVRITIIHALQEEEKVAEVHTS